MKNLTNSSSPRHDWTVDEIREIYFQPIFELIYQAATVHRQHHNSREVQMCTLLSVKTGGCPEDCGYCPQSAHHETFVANEDLLDPQRVLETAQIAKQNGSTRFCMGAAWREAKDGKDFDRVLEMIRGVNDLGMETCVTLGMLNADQAKKLKDAGLYAYNHNLDTSKEFYKQVITTRKYEDRLDTLEHISNADISVCCGGILGMGESEDDRIQLLHQLATLPVHPESVPVNALVTVPGTPLEKQKRVSVWEMVRMIAAARILIPNAMVRLSAGRTEMSMEEQGLCFLAGANSIFTGDRLLTTPNPEFDQDKEMFKLFDLKGREPFQQEKEKPKSEEKLRQASA